MVIKLRFLPELIVLESSLGFNIRPRTKYLGAQFHKLDAYFLNVGYFGGLAVVLEKVSTPPRPFFLWFLNSNLIDNGEHKGLNQVQARHLASLYQISYHVQGIQFGGRLLLHFQDRIVAMFDSLVNPFTEDGYMGTC